MEKTNQAQCEVKINWQSDDAHHCEHHYFERVDFSRDYFPGFLGDKLSEAGLNEWVSEPLQAGDIIQPYTKQLVHTLDRNRLSLETQPGQDITLRLGRFYPRNLIMGIPSINLSEITPLRVIEINDDTITVDLNHPLAKKKIDVSIRLYEWLPAKDERGGRCNNIVLETLAIGPGMQSICATNPTDFHQPEYFSRIDERPDNDTYSTPNLSALIDTAAEKNIQAVYAQHLREGMTIIDLMAGHDSHLPELPGQTVIGLGLNQEELDNNPKLSQRIIHDINAMPTLPLEDNFADAVTYSLSIEYLTQPSTLFNEVARIAKPGAPFMITFSEQWNAMKAIAQWSEMHAFERMGLVLDYFRTTHLFENLATTSYREWPRPLNDPEHEKKLFSDSIYGVCGFAK